MPLEPIGPKYLHSRTAVGTLRRYQASDGLRIGQVVQNKQTGTMAVVAEEGQRRDGEKVLVRTLQGQSSRWVRWIAYNLRFYDQPLRPEHVRVPPSSVTPPAKARAQLVRLLVALDDDPIGDEFSDA